MPQFLTAAISWIGSTIAANTTLGAFLIMNASAIASGALLLGGLAFSSSMAAKAKRKARDAYNAAQVDRLVNVVSTVAPRELVLGRVRKGGTVFFHGSTGVNKATYVMCVALAGHEIDGVETVYLNDVAVTLDGSGYVTVGPYAVAYRANGTATADSSGVATLEHEPIAGTAEAWTGTIAGPDGDLERQAVLLSGTTATTAPNARINYQYFAYALTANVRAVLGTADQAADARMQALFPGQWTAAHRARGVAYLICEFQYNETAYPSGLPVVTAVVRGARLHDPRTEVTEWSENPALMMRYVYTHANFGRGTVTSAENSRIASAANACDASHDYVVGGVTDTQPLYRAALVVPYGADAKDVFDDLAQAMAGSWAFAGGELYIKPGVWAGSVMSLTESDLAVVVRTGASEEQQPIAISVHRERAQKFNVVTPTIWDPAQDYKQVPITPVKADALIARDGVEIVQPVTMAAVNYAPQAQHVAGVLMRDARDALTVTLPFKLKAYPLELFDTIDLTIARYGWSGKLFQVLGREWSADGGIMLTLKETAEAIYTPDAAFLPQGYASNTNLPNAWYVPDLGELTITSGTDDLLLQSDGTVLTRMRVVWPAVDDRAVTEGGSIEVQYRPVLSDGAWSRAEVSGSETQLLITDAQDGNWYNVRARARTRNAVGIWSVQSTHQVIGKTEPPPAFDRFLVLAQPDGTRQFRFGYTTTTVPVDWLGAQIRYLAGSHLAPDWDAMTQLSDTATHYTASPVEVNVPPAGTYTFSCKSVDRSGNLSPYRLQTITLPDRRLGSVFDEWDEFAEGWAGTLTDCLINPSSYLEAIDTTTWATTPADWDTWERWNQNPTSPIYYETPARELGGVVTGQISVVLDADGSTTVELATSADGISWSSWGSVSGTFSARWIKLRVTVTATGPQPVPVVRGFGWLVDASLVREYVNDIDISTLTGSYRIGTGDVRMPLLSTYTLIKRSGVVVQDSSGGEWTAVRVDNSLSPSPRWQFRLAGTLADPQFVDFYVEGFAS